MDFASDIKYSYVSNPDNGNLHVRIVREEFDGGTLVYSKVIYETTLPCDIEHRDYITNGSAFKVFGKDIKEVNSDDCNYLLVTQLLRPSSEYECCECGGLAQYLVRSKHSTLMSWYCSRHAPAPLWDDTKQQAWIRLIGK